MDEWTLLFSELYKKIPDLVTDNDETAAGPDARPNIPWLYLMGIDRNLPYHVPYILGLPDTSPIDE